MITSDLIEYIKLELSKGISKDLIISNLSSAGWHLEDIEEGFLDIESQMPQDNIYKTDTYNSSESGDIYSVSEVVSRTEPVKIEEPIVTKEEVEEKKVEPTKSIEPYNLEIQSNNKDRIDNAPTIETPKIWIPTVIKAKTIDPEEAKVDTQLFNTSVFNDKKEPEKVEEFIPTINKNLSSSPAPILDSQAQQQKILTPKYNSTSGQMVDVLPKSAMISSLSQDVLSVSKEKEDTLPRKRNRFLKWIIWIILILIIAGSVFAFVTGYLKIPWTNFSLSLVKKDPKSMILNYASNMSKLESYKVDSNITISIPSLSSITTGLSSGEAVASSDRDSISVITKGAVNRVNNNLKFDYLATLKSSIFENDIISDIKFDGSNLQISIPDLSQIIDKDAPDSTVVSMNPSQLGSIVSELSPITQDEIKSIDVYDIISKGIPLYVKNEVSISLKNFINSMEYLQKGEESIKGVDTYHYLLTTDRQSTKKLLTEIADIFINNLSEEQKQELYDALGSSTMNSLDVWVGKDNSNIYQIKLAFTLPLSKVLRVNDSGIAGNEVNIDWQMTCYDLNVPNDIRMSDTATPIDSFINDIEDLKLKNLMSSFKSQAVLLKNATGSYGGKSNTGGSCTEPISGSLFSPLGHAKTAGTAVGAISNFMNSFLTLTNKEGVCYSTTKDWALSAPLKSASSDLSSMGSLNQDSYYCIDSTGKGLTLSSLITGSSCK